MSKKYLTWALLLPPKERILILAEETARRTYSPAKARLTADERHTLINSFKARGEVRIYNKWAVFSNTIFHAMNLLIGQYNVVMKNYSDLRAYMLTLNGIETAEHLANRILSEIKDPKDRSRIAKKGAREVRFYFSETRVNEEGYIKVTIDPPVFMVNEEDGSQMGYTDETMKQKKLTFKILINNVRVEARQSAIKYLSWRRAVVEYIDSSGFKTETLSGTIDSLTEDVNADILGWTKYLERYNSEPGNRMERLRTSFIVAPEVKGLPVDEEQYRTFRNRILS